MSKIKKTAVLRALLAAGVPEDRAKEIAESAAKINARPAFRPWQINPPDPRALARLGPYTCQPLVPREEREAA